MTICVHARMATLVHAHMAIWAWTHEGVHPPRPPPSTLDVPHSYRQHNFLYYVYIQDPGYSLWVPLDDIFDECVGITVGDESYPHNQHGYEFD